MTTNSQPSFPSKSVAFQVYKWLHAAREKWRVWPSTKHSRIRRQIIRPERSLSLYIGSRPTDWWHPSAPLLRTSGNQSALIEDEPWMVVSVVLPNGVEPILSLCASKFCAPRFSAVIPQGLIEIILILFVAHVLWDYCLFSVGWSFLFAHFFLSLFFDFWHLGWEWRWVAHSRTGCVRSGFGSSGSVSADMRRTFRCDGPKICVVVDKVRELNIFIHLLRLGWVFWDGWIGKKPCFDGFGLRRET